MQMRRSAVALTAVLMLVMATPVRAQGSALDLNAFAACDGYGAPSSGGDGMLDPAEIGGIFRPRFGANGDTTRAAVRYGAAGVETCQVALNHERLETRYWERRVNLMRSLAMHQIAATDFAGARETLDSAAQISGPNRHIFYDQSLGASLEILSAYLRLLERDFQGADEMLASVRTRWPYSYALAASMAVVRDTRANIDGPEWRHLAKLDPSVFHQTYDLAAEAGNTEEIIKVYPQLDPEIFFPGGFEATFEDPESLIGQWEYNVEVWLAERIRYALALANAGRKAEAEQALVQARQALDHARATVPRAGRFNGAAANLYRTRSTPLIELGEAAIKAAEGAIAEAGAPSQTSPLSSNVVVDSVILPNPATVMAVFSRVMPEAQNPSKNPQFSFLSASNVFLRELASAHEPGAADPLRERIEFENEYTTLPTSVEDITLLAAALRARALGKTGLVITARFNITNYEVDILGESPYGYSTLLDVEFVDLENAPERFRDFSSRVLDVEDVIARLAPLYGEPHVPGNPRRLRTG